MQRLFPSPWVQGPCQEGQAEGHPTEIQGSQTPIKSIHGYEHQKHFQEEIELFICVESKVGQKSDRTLYIQDMKMSQFDTNLQEFKITD